MVWQNLRFNANNAIKHKATIFSGYFANFSKNMTACCFVVYSFVFEKMRFPKNFYFGYFM
ncbi:hypothetical protein X875_16370 [Mannheimia varigena USDA-ARS-USMARC-1388]|uniref:Uncharacterized protein n=1 Tax=Mannheimia varigena USDA-ARS-USMARC-1296 TaxID=1433287 RepID=W0QCL4_9PAST|nr:hypothetical protein X808_4400 [Mannheimia varigena USDA-ARS-USMARC-1296]AHG80255.1 hypothetical protein X875_16370 [Mannheimia varigena USDA-ARS-USMARC-1388]